MSETETLTQAPVLMKIEGLHKHYKLGTQDLHILRGVSAEIRQGEWIGVFGSSGSGKSTLLHLMAALDTPDQGDVFIEGDSVFNRSTMARDALRNRDIGLVFQAYHLLPELTVMENTIISAMMGPFWQWPIRSAKMRKRAKTLLGDLGLGERFNHKPNQLSGGERQRVAIARALINEPAILLADEPTGNLDKTTGAKILDLFADLHRNGQTIIMVSHDPSVAERADRSLNLHEGQLVD